MIVKCLFVEVGSTTWGLGEAQRESVTTEEGESVRELRRFKENDVIGVLRVNCLGGPLSQWEQNVAVK